MGYSQAERFKHYVNNQLLKWFGAIQVLLPIFEQLKINKFVDEYCSGIELLRFPPPAAYVKRTEVNQ